MSLQSLVLEQCVTSKTTTIAKNIPSETKNYKNNLITSMENFIFNEDCLKGMQRIPSGSVDTVITDPPYGISKLKSFKSNSNGEYKAIDAAWDIYSSKQEYLDFSRQWLLEAFRVLKPQGSIAVWGSKISIFEIQPVIASIFPKYLELLTWIKRDSPPNMTQRGLAPSTEFALIFCKSTTGWTFNHQEIKKYNGGKQARNYIDIQRSMPKTERTGHPTQKKIETQQFLIEMLSNRNEIILDPFLGSGTSLVAAKSLARKYIGFELNSKYFEIAKNRLARTECV